MVVDVLRALIALPMPFLVIGLAGLALSHRPRASRRLLVVAAAGLAIASVPAVGKLLLLPLEASVRPWSLEDGAPTTAILVPTGGYYTDGRGGWWPHAASMKRLVLALEARAAMRRRGIEVPIIVSGGATRARLGAPAEATVLVHRLGLDQDRGLVLETDALDSVANARATARILDGHAAPRVVVVTDRYHLARMSALLRHQGIEPLGLAVSAGREAGASLLDLVPQPRGLDIANKVTHNYVGLLVYLVTGRLGITDFWAVAAPPA